MPNSAITEPITAIKDHSKSSKRLDSNIAIIGMITPVYAAFGAPILLVSSTYA